MSRQNFVCGEEQKSTRHGSAIWNLYKRFLAFLFSVFERTGTGKFIISNDSYFKSSAIGKFIKKKNLGRTSPVAEKINLFFSKSRVVEFFKRMTSAVLSLSVNVYAIFFAVYGITSMLIHYALMFVDFGKDNSLGGLIASGIIIILSIPFLTSTRSLTEIVSTSVFMGKIVREFLLIPEEHLQNKKRIGSTVHMLISSALGLMVGLLTYFTEPVVAPIVFLCTVLILVIMSFPESGVMMIAVVVPFLQYAERLRVVLPVLVCVTCTSYLFKAFGGKRVGTHSAQGTVLAFFCVFMLLASSFTAGGWETFLEGAYMVVLIAGGFYITYNLMKTREKLRVCTRALVVSFGILVIMGIWDMIYGGGVADILKSSWREAGSIISDRIFYIADSASNFGIIACFICPIIFCDACSKKSVSGVTFSLICLITSIAAMLVYGTYESLAAIAIGLLAYVIFHSKKSFTAFVIVIIIVCIALNIAFSFIPVSVGEKIIDTVQSLKPVNDPVSDVRDELDRNTWEMLENGNLGGVGVGERAFREAFLPYASETALDAVSPSNLYLQIICWSGIGGLAVFIMFLFLVFKNAIGYMMISTDKAVRKRVLAFLCGVGSVLLLGSVTNLWSDVRMFVLFWMMLALLCGYVRLGREAEERKILEYTNQPDRVDTSLRIHD